MVWCCWQYARIGVTFNLSPGSVHLVDEQVPILDASVLQTGTLPLPKAVVLIDTDGTINIANTHITQFENLVFKPARAGVQMFEIAASLHGEFVNVDFVSTVGVANAVLLTNNSTQTFTGCTFNGFRNEPVQLGDTTYAVMIVQASSGLFNGCTWFNCSNQYGAGILVSGLKSGAVVVGSRVDRCRFVRSFTLPRT